MSSCKAFRHRPTRGGDRQANAALYVALASYQAVEPTTVADRQCKIGIGAFKPRRDGTRRQRSNRELAPLRAGSLLTRLARLLEPLMIHQGAVAPADDD
jgi:hypothetical protein